MRPARPASSGRRGLRDQAGAAVVSVTLGVLVFMIMLFTATQTMYAMYLGSTVEGVSYDAARIVAQSGSSSDPSARARATAHVHQLLANTEGVQVSFDGSTDDVVQVTVRATPPTLVGPSLGLPWLDDLSKTTRVRVEHPIEPQR